MSRVPPILRSTDPTTAGGVLTTTLVALSGIWRRCRKALFDRYRPELHYMRGPGPKCREKARAQLLAKRQ